MAIFRDRTCTTCGAVEYNTATRSDVCLKCAAEAKANARIEPERKILEDLGYSDISLLGKNSHGKREWQFTHECGTVQSWIFPNIRKRLAIDPNTAPCSKCGGQRRMSIAMAAYEEKYGITPEQLADLERYTKKVRGLTGKTYKLYEGEINPLGLKRGQGPDDWHLDHITPIVFGFKNNLPPEFIAREENLQMLTAKDNLSKGRK